MSGRSTATTSSEVELDVDPRFEVPSLDGASPSSRAGSTPLTTTPSTLRLLDQGITVRRRSGEGTRWTVSSSAEVGVAGGLARREVDIDLDAQLPATVTELVAQSSKATSWPWRPGWCGA